MLILLSSSVKIRDILPGFEVWNPHSLGQVNSRKAKGSLG